LGARRVAAVTPEPIRIVNTLGLEKQEFRPREAGRVSMYTCGPTVYKFAHVGNFRTYLTVDFWVRAFEHLGYQVTQVQNFTDVGHLLYDLEESGEDKLLLAAAEEGKAPEEIAAYYTEAFLRDRDLLRIKPAAHYPRATEFIPQMIELIRRLEGLGLTYQIDGSVLYDVGKRTPYPKLSRNTLEQLQAGYRVQVDPNKRHPADFLLWKAAGDRRKQIWDSPWGPGFPGWHLECSAMSLHYFPEGFDVHTGGVDLIFPHHDDEIAQSEPVAGFQVVDYWIHSEFLQMDGRKMAKSAGNIVTVGELTEMGYDPLAFRYLTMGARYRSSLSFSEASMQAAQRGLDGLRQRASTLPAPTTPASAGALDLDSRFRSALADDLDLPRVAALLPEVLRADIPPGEKRHLLEDWDRVLQLDLTREAVEPEVPGEVAALAVRRDAARAARDFTAADSLRAQIEGLGWHVEDTPTGTKLRRISPPLGGGD
jgi:cysteinyl-tRNA synthetase